MRNVTSLNTKALFVTATGTAIGKTFVCAGLISRLRVTSRAVRAIKPVVSGFDPTSTSTSDTGILLTALGLPVSEKTIATISPWRYKAALSPNMAARAERTSIDVDAVIAFCERAIDDAGETTVLIEGVGGLMVPLDERRTVVDWAAALSVPVLLVAGSYLGAVSHTLTCLEVLRVRHVPVAAILVNETPGGIDLAATVETIAAFAKPTEVLALARGADDAPRVRVYERILTLAASTAADDDRPAP